MVIYYLCEQKQGYIIKEVKIMIEKIITWFKEKIEDISIFIQAAILLIKI